jgi:hypothetical protein
MVLKTDSLNPNREEKKTEPVGEVRLDHEKKGYFHIYSSEELKSKFGIETKVLKDEDKEQNKQIDVKDVKEEQVISKPKDDSNKSKVKKKR